MQACNLVKTDDVSKIKLCSKHFFPNDFIDANAKLIGGRMTLKSKAFPRKFVPNIIVKTNTSEAVISPLQSTSAIEQGTYLYQKLIISIPIFSCFSMHLMILTIDLLFNRDSLHLYRIL